MQNVYLFFTNNNNKLKVFFLVTRFRFNRQCRKINKKYLWLLLKK